MMVCCNVSSIEWHSTTNVLLDEVVVLTTMNLLFYTFHPCYIQ